MPGQIICMEGDGDGTTDRVFQFRIRSNNSIERSTTLSGTWTHLGTVQTGTFTDPNPPPGSAFYRVLLLHHEIPPCRLAALALIAILFPSSALIEGTNTLTITPVSGSGTKYQWLSPGLVFDCVQLDAP